MPLPVDELSSCEGKKRYPSYGAAQAAIVRRLRVGASQRCHVYRCEVCRNWHNGSGKARRDWADRRPEPRVRRIFCTGAIDDDR